VHERTTGQIDVAVDSDDDAYDAIRDFLSYLPSHAGGPLPRRAARGDLGPNAALRSVVPERRSQTYDVRDVLHELADDGELLELKPAFGASVVTALARIDGWPVGVVASQPAYLVGSLTPDACSKATRLVCLCDAFGLPVLFLQDTPGFLVGTNVEHDRLLARAMLFLEALCLARVPRISVVLRKAFGLAFFSLAGSPDVADLVLAWPGAEIGFMDPTVGANVLYSDELDRLPEGERLPELQRRAADLASATDPYAPASIMRLDDIIDPADTRVALVRALRRHAGRPFSPGWERPLAAWPTIW
jgi:acetyl-CoA carboxylase carboxyltransferase component